MPIKESMTWVAARKGWMKYVPADLVPAVGKKMVAVSCRQLGTRSTKEASIQAANDWWATFLASHTKPAEPKQELWEKRRHDMARWFRANGDESQAVAIMGEDASYIKDIFKNQINGAVWQDRFNTFNKATSTERALSTHAKAWLDHKRIAVDQGQLSIGRWDNLRSALRRFENFIGGDEPIDAITSPKWVAYHDHLKQLPELEDYAQRDTFAIAKQFITHLVESDLIPAPGKLRSRSLSFSVGTRQIITYDIAELMAIYHKAVDRTKLFLLLAMNCGMTQIDISDLQKTQVDLKAGTIQRKRSKTEDWANAPKVTYKLWPQTLKLLKQFAGSGPNVLTTEDGKPLMQDSLDGERRSKSDNIRSAYQRALDAAKVAKDDRKSFKIIRKTSSSMLEKHTEYSRYAQYFLAQAPRSVADKHYVVPSQERFDATLAWLATQYGV